MKSFLTVLAIVFTLTFFNANVANAHGVKWEVSQIQAQGFIFSYADGSTIKKADVKVFGPNDPQKLYQEGKTDKNGNFAFIPNSSGAWILTANDGSGHLVTAKLSLKDEDLAKVQSETSSEINMANQVESAVKPYKMGVIVSILLNIALLALYFKRKKN